MKCRAPVGGFCFCTKGNKNDPLQFRVAIQRSFGLFNGDGTGLVQRIAVDAATDGGEGYGVETVFVGHGEGPLVAASEKLRLAPVATVPDRANSVNDMPGRQPVPFGYLGVAGFTAVQLPACGQQFWFGSSVDGAIHYAATQQRTVGGIDNGVHRKFRDVSRDDFDTLVHESPPMFWSVPAAVRG